MKENPKEELAKARAVAMACRLGKIPYNEAKRLCEDHLSIVNKRIKEMALKYGQRAHSVTFASLLR